MSKQTKPRKVVLSEEQSLYLKTVKNERSSLIEQHTAAIEAADHLEEALQGAHERFMAAIEELANPEPGDAVNIEFGSAGNDSSIVITIHTEDCQCEMCDELSNNSESEECNCPACRLKRKMQTEAQQKRLLESLSTKSIH
jgi:hypothetical protein